MIRLKRKPTSPGEILKEEYLHPLGLTQKELADHIECDVKVINRIVNSRTALTASLAIKLAAAFDTTPEFWLNAQKAMDVYQASKEMKKLPKTLLTKRHLVPIY
ncbi:MAG: HigA family addiction module antidote protein [Deltaproteobacteria bacterium]|nr:HigA family addiction module antidote protein [Deltaproteobacteria bacterium]